MEAIHGQMTYWEMHLHDLCLLASTPYRKVEFQLIEDNTGIPSITCIMIVDNLKLMKADQVLMSGQTMKEARPALKDRACKLMARYWMLYGLENIQRGTNHPGLDNTIHQIQSKE